MHFNTQAHEGNVCPHKLSKYTMVVRNTTHSSWWSQDSSEDLLQ